MIKPNRPIFRDRALKHYIQRQEKDVLPHLVSPPVFMFFWILLGLLLIVGCIAWRGEVPTYVAGSGVILEGGSHSQSGHNKATALIFLPVNQPLKLRIGLPLQLQIGVTGPRFTGQIEQVEPGIISPLDARKRYALSSSVAQVITQPSIVLIVSVGPVLSAHTYAGSIVSTQVQSGSRRVLSLLPGLDRLIGG